MTKTKKRKLNQQHHHHCLPHHQPTHPLQDQYNFFKRKIEPFLLTHHQNAQIRASRGRFQVDQRKLVEFETQPRTECNDEGATSAIGLWNLNQRRRTGQRRQGGQVRDLSERLEKVKEIFRKVNGSIRPSPCFFFLKISGRAGRFTRFRSQGIRNQPEKPNFKIN